MHLKVLDPFFNVADTICNPYVFYVITVLDTQMMKQKNINKMYKPDNIR